MRILVCGGRDYTTQANKYKVISVLDECEPSLIISGGATGADRHAEGWARYNEIAFLVVPAQWEKHGKAAGPIRNKRMLSIKPDLVIAFLGGKGTANMISLAKKQGIEVRKIKE